MFTEGEMKGHMDAKGLTSPAEGVSVDEEVSVSASEPGRAGRVPANIDLPEGESTEQLIQEDDDV